MRGKLALAASVALLGAGVVLWRATRPAGTPPPPPPRSGSATASLTGTPTNTPDPSLPTAPPERDPRDQPPVPPADAALDATVVKQGLDELHGRIHEAVTPCFAKLARPATPRRIAFRYRLVVAKRRAHLEEPKIFEASFELGDADACFEKALGQLAFDLDMPDMTTPVQDEFTGSEL